MSLLFCDIVERLDRQFLMFVNGHHAPWLDRLFWAITQTYAWIPFYLLVIYLLFRCYREHAWQVVLLIVLAVAVSDVISSGICKPLLHRLRPTHTPGLAEHLRIFVRPNGTPYYGGLYGFPSSHATNSTTIAILTYSLLTPFVRKRWPLALFLFFYVLIFCYTRPYFGVHYPTDILAGWCLGATIGILVSVWMRKQYLPRCCQGEVLAQASFEYDNYKL
jgi:undecaprenyl-diphosphatase